MADFEMKSAICLYQIRPRPAAQHVDPDFRPYLRRFVRLMHTIGDEYNATRKVACDKKRLGVTWIHSREFLSDCTKPKISGGRGCPRRLLP